MSELNLTTVQNTLSYYFKNLFLKIGMNYTMDMDAEIREIATDIYCDIAIVKVQLIDRFVIDLSKTRTELLEKLESMECRIRDLEMDANHEN